MRLFHNFVDIVRWNLESKPLLQVRQTMQTSGRIEVSLEESKYQGPYQGRVDC